MPVSAMKAAFKLPSAARFINKEGRDDFRNLLLILSDTDIIYLIM